MTRTDDAESGDVELRTCRHHVMNGGRVEVTVTRMQPLVLAAARMAAQRGARRKESVGPDGTDVHVVKPGFVQVIVGEFMLSIRFRRTSGGAPPDDVLERLARQALTRADWGASLSSDTDAAPEGPD